MFGVEATPSTREVCDVPFEAFGAPAEPEPIPSIKSLEPSYPLAIKRDPRPPLPPCFPICSAWISQCGGGSSRTLLLPASSTHSVSGSFLSYPPSLSPRPRLQGEQNLFYAPCIYQSHLDRDFPPLQTDSKYVARQPVDPPSQIPQLTHA